MSKEINVENIMNEIRADIKKRGLTDDALPFDSVSEHDVMRRTDFDMNALEMALSKYAMTCKIDPYPPILKSKGGLLGSFQVLFKKVIRKCVNFHVTPIVLAINDSNNENLENLKQIRDLAKIQATKEEQEIVSIELNRNLKKANVILETKNSELEQRIVVLEKDLASIKSAINK